MTNLPPHPPSVGFAIVAIPGTCGELVQGQFSNGTDFLVTLPVDLWSTVRPPWNVNAMAQAAGRKTSDCCCKPSARF